MEYDFTLPKKVVTFTLFNDPSSPYDFKAELQTENRMDIMMELSTPIEMIKQAKIKITANTASQPWTVKVEGSLNDQTFTAEGRLWLHCYSYVR